MFIEGLLGAYHELRILNPSPFEDLVLSGVLEIAVDVPISQRRKVNLQKRSLAIFS